MGDEKLILEKNLDPANRWVKLAKEVQWDELEYLYCRKIDLTKIHPYLAPRSIIAALIVKYKLLVNSEETIRLIKENPYLQHFVDIEPNHIDSLLTPNLLRMVRELFGKEDWQKFKDIILYKSTGVPFSFRRIFIHPKKISIPIPPEVDFNNQTATNKDYNTWGIIDDSSKKRLSRSERRKKRRKSRIKRKIKRVYEYLIWIAIISVIVGSLIMIFSQVDFRDQKKVKKIQQGRTR